MNSSTNSSTVSAKSTLLNYFQESFQELKKVTWPTRNQAIRLTAIVLGFCFVAAAVMGVLDLAFNQGYRLLVNYAGKVVPQTTPASNTGTPAKQNPTSNAPSVKVNTSGGDASVSVQPLQGQFDPTKAKNAGATSNSSNSNPKK